MKPVHWLLAGAAVIGGYLLYKRSGAGATAHTQPVLTDPKSSGQYQATYGGSSDGVDIYDVRLVGSSPVLITYAQRGSDASMRRLVAAPGTIPAENANLIKLYGIVS